MLGKAKLTAFVATAKPAKARAFYQRTLGLRLLAEDKFALAFDSNGVQLRIQKVEKLKPMPFTALGWEVRSLRRAMAALSKSGVAFERYPFLEQDDAGVWTAPGGTKVAWFNDPDGNVLSLAESPTARSSRRS
jgi:catechol 2,3-dioxygenase-like lactoylglutathione lyase family enzyme